MFRVLCACNLLLILPMMAIGMMAGLSGGGLNPAYQRIGTQFLVWSTPLAIGCTFFAELLWRLGLTLPAYLLNLTPLLVWSGLWFQLRRSTNNFKGG